MLDVVAICNTALARLKKLEYELRGKNPSEQLSAFTNKVPTDALRRDILDNLLISGKCVDIMERQDKKVEDYLEFLDARFDCIAAKLAKWGIDSIAASENMDAIPDQDENE